MKKILKAKYDCRGMDNGEIIDTILNDRDIEDLQEFLHPSEDSLIPFEDMENMEKAYAIIDDGITMGYKFLVFGDVDADGISSAAIMVKYLEMSDADVSYTINQGKEHGVENFDLSLLNDIDVMIIVDSLNNDPAIYKRITDLGVQLVIFDHHIPQEELLNSDVPFVLVSSAVDYPNEDLSGAGVCLKYVLYADYMNLTDYAEKLWVYGAIGICADMCSMASPENRYIVNKGLADFKNPIVQKMVGNYQFNTESIQFSIGPLVNAAMRMSENEKALDLFVSDDEDEIDELVKDLKKCKENQNKIVDSLIDDLLKQGEKQLDKKCMFFFLGDVNADVGGLLANRLLSVYQRPLFILKDKGDQWAGSMRAVCVDNFLEIANNTGLCLCQGHPLAAGAFIDKDKFDEFKIAIENVLKNVEFKTEIEADVEISAKQVNEQLIKQLNALNRISGNGWPSVKVLIRTDNYEVSTFSTKKHLKVIDDSGLLLVKWNDMSWKTMDNNGEFIGVGTLAAPYYGRNKFFQLTMNDYVKLDKSEEL